MDKLRRLLFAYAETSAAHHFEKFVSGIGALLAILLIAVINPLIGTESALPLVIASMGASAVLVFAMPHSPLTQPWPLLGGQFVSALIGVMCAQLVSNALLAAALAVGLALLVMYYLSCLHPPGGATALNAVVGGAAVHELGYHYVLMPVMVDTLAILVVAVVFNYCFPWRRYPLSLVPQRHKAASSADVVEPYIGQEDIRHALNNMGSFVDVSEQDLSRIYTLAAHHAERLRMRPENILLGHCYSNGRPGSEWEIRKVIDESGVTAPGKDKIIYRIVAGARARTTGICSRADFAHWAKYEMVQENGVWKRTG